MPGSAADVQEATAWLVKADRDLQAAELALTARRPLRDIAVYHCQQACEKSLKAFLAWYGAAARRTHNLTELLADCMRFDSTLTVLANNAQVLTPYAADFRYPGSALEPDAADASDALRLAREVYDAICARLQIQPSP